MFLTICSLTIVAQRLKPGIDGTQRRRDPGMGPRNEKEKGRPETAFIGLNFEDNQTEPQFVRV